MKNNTKRMLTLAVMMATSPLYAATTAEVESNDTINSSQYLTSVNPVIIPAAIGTVGATVTMLTPNGPMTMPVTTEDVDFYSFYANAGDDITVDIDNGIGGQQSVNTNLGLFDSNLKLVRTNDMADSIDSGSTSTDDARIDHYIALTSGIHYVGVSSDGRQFRDGGSVDVYSASAGDYELIITKVPPVVTSSSSSTTTTTSSPLASAPAASAIQYIDLEVKPGSREFTPTNPSAKGVVPIALLSKKGFNAMDIDPATLTFGAKGTEASISKCNPTGVDVNGDGLLDMMCHFNNQSAGLKSDTLEGIARGSAKGGAVFEGHGILKVKIANKKAKKR